MNWTFRGSVTQLTRSLSTLRRRGSPPADARLGSGGRQLCRVGLGTHWVPIRDFTSSPCTSFLDSVDPTRLGLLVAPVTVTEPRSRTMVGTKDREQSAVERRRRNDLHKLDVYRCALELYRRVGRIVAEFPRGEADLRSQMRRASRSVLFNIGEGVGKRGRARAAAYEIPLGETKELIVALDCVEIDRLAPVDEVLAAQDLADRIAAMLTKLIRSAEPGQS